tara:strand:- start:7842 stop:8357 length:516 start_codon:yes stop_codon:yes gene_type:complete
MNFKKMTKNFVEGKFLVRESWRDDFRTIQDLLENLKVRTDNDKSRLSSIKRRLKSLKTELSKMERNLNEAIEERDILLEGIIVETSSVAGGDVEGAPATDDDGPFPPTVDRDLTSGDTGGPYNVTPADASESFGTKAGGPPRPGARKALTKAVSRNVSYETDAGKESQFGD